MSTIVLLVRSRGLSTVRTTFASEHRVFVFSAYDKCPSFLLPLSLSSLLLLRSVDVAEGLSTGNAPAIVSLCTRLFKTGWKGLALKKRKKGKRYRPVCPSARPLLALGQS